MDTIGLDVQKEFSKYQVPAVKAYILAIDELHNEDLVIIAREKQGVIDCKSHVRASFAADPNTPRPVRDLLAQSPRSFNGLGPGLGFWLFVELLGDSYAIPMVYEDPEACPINTRNVPGVN